MFESRKGAKGTGEPSDQGDGHVDAVGADPREAVRSPEATRRDADTYRELFERSADAILIIEGDTFIDCNQATVRMLRYRDKKQLLMTHPSELSPPRQPDGRLSFEKANEMIALAFEQGSHRFEWEHLRADGEIFPVEVLLTAIQEPDRKILHVVWRDITARKALETELHHAQKMEAIGKLAGGIAHDFNNLLVAIVGNADLLRLALPKNDRTGAYIDQLHLAADRAAALVQQLLTFSRKEEVIEQAFEANDRIRDIESLLARLIGEDIALQVVLADEPLHVVGKGSAFEQLLLNLASNARDAMPMGGTLRIETGLVDASTPRRGLGEALPEGDWMSLTVADTGCGMPQEVASKAFDPYFTTKPMGKGTGLGLATVYGIVKRAGGRISIDSVAGEGTRIVAHLPLARSWAPEPAPRPSATPEPGGSETILIAEDEPAVSTMLKQVLAQCGYAVLSAANGREALDTYLRRSREVDLLITDVIMPELGGPELVRELAKAGHMPRVLFISGYTDDELSRLEDLRAEVDLLRKPFRARELVGRVRLSLDREAEAAAED